MNFFLFFFTTIFWFLFFFYYQILILFHIQIFFLFVVLSLYLFFYYKLKVISLIFWKYIFMLFFWNICIFLVYTYFWSIILNLNFFLFFLYDLFYNHSIITVDTIKAVSFFSCIKRVNFSFLFFIFLSSLSLNFCFILIGIFDFVQIIVYFSLFFCSLYIIFLVSTQKKNTEILKYFVIIFLYYLSGEFLYVLFYSIPSYDFAFLIYLKQYNSCIFYTNTLVQSYIDWFAQFSGRSKYIKCVLTNWNTDIKLIDLYLTLQLNVNWNYSLKYLLFLNNCVSSSIVWCVYTLNHILLCLFAPSWYYQLCYTCIFDFSYYHLFVNLYNLIYMALLFLIDTITLTIFFFFVDYQGLYVFFKCSIICINSVVNLIKLLIFFLEKLHVLITSFFG